MKEKEIICFHNPDEENGYLSNWYPSVFQYGGREYSSMEQYMMHQKAICFLDKTTAEEIMETNDAAEIKRLGRLVNNYNDHIWNGVRQIAVFEGLYEKFAQNEELKKQLLTTGEALLAECAVKDRVWGIGMSMSDPDRFNQKKWNGENLLGYSLMMVRQKLRSAQ